MSSPSLDSAVIVAEGLGKAYRIWDSPSARLRQPLTSAVARLLPGGALREALAEGRLGSRPAYRDFHALRDVSFSVGRGEAVGIVGRNGSGKSTLLQLIAGTLSASSGRVETRGRVAALLELGSGFNPEFSGRENVVLNAGVLGLSPTEVSERFDDIVAYSEIGEFIDQPVRTYSSGMMLRLAFAVAAHVDPDVLIVDEALGVGDARFQLKCARTIDQFLARGTTLLFVSHDSSSIKRLCSRALLLEKGRLLHEGPPNEVVNLYSKLLAEGDVATAFSPAPPQPSMPAPAPAAAPQAEGEGELLRLRGRVAELEARLAGLQARVPDKRAEALLSEQRPDAPATGAEFAYGGSTGSIDSIHVLDTSGAHRLVYSSGEPVRIVAEVTAREPFPEPIFALTIKASNGLEVYGTNTLFAGRPAEALPAGGRRRVVFSLPLDLMPGHYFLSLGFTHFVGEELVVAHRRYDALEIEVVPRDRTFGIANLRASISMEELPPVAP